MRVLLSGHTVQGKQRAQPFPIPGGAEQEPGPRRGARRAHRVRRRADGGHAHAAVARAAAERLCACAGVWTAAWTSTSGGTPTLCWPGRRTHAALSSNTIHTHSLDHCSLHTGSRRHAHAAAADISPLIGFRGFRVSRLACLVMSLSMVRPYRVTSMVRPYRAGAAKSWSI